MPAVVEGALRQAVSPLRTRSHNVCVSRSLRTVACFVVFVAGVQAAAASDLSGLVRDVCGRVIPGTRMTLRDASGAIVETFTGGGGLYAFHNVSSGQWTLTAQVIGLQPYSEGILVTTNNDAEHDIRVLYDLTVRLAMTVSDGDPSLKYRRYVVHGVVRDQNGQPIAGAALRLQGTTTYVRPAISDGCTTDERGRYILDVWSPKRERWTLSVAGESRVTYSLQDLELVPDEPHLVDILLRTR